MATQDLVDKLKETLGGGSHPEHPETSTQPQHQHVSEDTQSENLETRRNEPQQGGSSTQKVRSLIDGVYDTTSTNTNANRQVEQHSETSPKQQNPRDAAHVPPSVLAQHVGEPSIEHDYPHDSKTERHSSLSHQEEHYNIR